MKTRFDDLVVVFDGRFCALEVERALLGLVFGSHGGFGVCVTNEGNGKDDDGVLINVRHVWLRFEMGESLCCPRAINTRARGLCF